MRDGFGTFRRAAAGEAEQVFDLIRQRIAWMDERGIQQWNHPGYLRRYPLDYFRQCAEEGQLYALWTECGVLAAGAVVLEEDPRWTGYGGKALYVHNLAASLHFSGAGTELLRRCLALAAERGQDYLRLDCARDNPVLHDYYERFGFRFVAPVEDQGYLGDLLQYPLGSRDGAGRRHRKDQKEGLSQWEKSSRSPARWWWPPGSRRPTWPTWSGWASRA